MNTDGNVNNRSSTNLHIMYKIIEERKYSDRQRTFRNANSSGKRRGREKRVSLLYTVYCNAVLEFYLNDNQCCASLKFEIDVCVC